MKKLTLTCLALTGLAFASPASANAYVSGAGVWVSYQSVADHPATSSAANCNPCR